MRLRVNIPQVDPTAMDAPEVCPYEDCDGEYFTPHQQHYEKPVRDPEYDQVNAMRWKCLKCGRTHWVYLEGVSEAERSDRLKAAGVMLYLLGISYRGVEDFLTAWGCPVDHVTVYRDVQEAGKKAQKRREEWVKQAGKAKVVGGDPTHARCAGEDVVIGVAVDAQEGFVLSIDVLENKQTETLYQWLQPISELVDAEVLTTDDDDAFKTVVDYYVLMLSIDATAALRQISDEDPNVFIWDAMDIARKLKNYPVIVEDFFGEAWRAAFCGP